MKNVPKKNKKSFMKEFRVILFYQRFSAIDMFWTDSLYYLF